MDHDRFDDLTRTLAAGISRRRALELSGGVLTGGLAAVLGRRRAAQAQPGGECAAFCNALFPAGPARGACKRQAARGEGICVACGADVEKACVAADGTTSCPDRDCAVGFEFDEDTCACTCASDLCVDAAGAEICCAPEQDCGVVGAFADRRGCCRPSGADVEGGCNEETREQCCWNPCFPGSTNCFQRSCDLGTDQCCLDTGQQCAPGDVCCAGSVCDGSTCVLESAPAAARAGESGVITQVFAP